MEGIIIADEIFKEMIYKDNVRIAEEVTVLNFDKYKGYFYYILNVGTHPCSYIVLDEGDKLFGKSMSELDETNIYCHGGFTYASDKLQSPTYSYVSKYENKWVIGYDYGHYRDWAGYMSKEDNEMLGNKKWTTSELRSEVREVIDSIVYYNNHGDD